MKRVNHRNIDRIGGIFSACGDRPPAEGRSILTIQLILSKCFSKKKSIPRGSGFCLHPAAFYGAAAKKSRLIVIIAESPLEAAPIFKIS